MERNAGAITPAAEPGIASANTPKSLPPPERIATLELRLDPLNPRLGRSSTGAKTDEILRELIEGFKLEELAESILESGFLPFDPMLGLRDGKTVTVIEGNRRLAALQLLLEPGRAPDDYKEKWKVLAARASDELTSEIREIPIVVVDSRDDPRIQAYIGFRHVTGVSDWPAYEKAAFIARMLESDGGDFATLGRRLGHRGNTVEKHYLAYKLVQQAREGEVPGALQARDSFGVLLRSLNSPGVVAFLGLTGSTTPKKDFQPIHASRIPNLKEFVRWTFGTDKVPKVVRDSRKLTQWGKILLSESAVAYMRRVGENSAPEFERAWVRSGGESESINDALLIVSDRLQEVAPVIGEHVGEALVIQAMRDCTRFFRKIIPLFPEIGKEYGIGLVAATG